MIRVGLALVALPLPATAFARTYADTCVERESGDIGGHIVTLLGPTTHSRVAFSWSDGSLRGPITVPAKRRGPMLAFTVRTDAGTFRFHGHVDERRLAGSLVEPWDGRPRPIVLRAQPLARAETPVIPCASPAPH